MLFNGLHTLKHRQRLPLYHHLLATSFCCLSTRRRLVPWSASAVLVSFTWEFDDCAPSSQFLLLELPSVLELEKSHYFLSLCSSFKACSKLKFLLWLFRNIPWASWRTSFLFWPLLFSLVAASYDPQNLQTRSLILCQCCLQRLGSLCSEHATFGLSIK